MTKCTLILFILLPTIYIGCSNEIPADNSKIKNEKKKKILLSTNTTIGASEIATISINIPTVKCEMCKENINKALDKTNGVIEADINIKSKIAKVKFDKAITTPNQIRGIIANAGYNADDVTRNESAYSELEECCQ